MIEGAFKHGAPVTNVYNYGIPLKDVVVSSRLWMMSLGIFVVTYVRI